MEKAYKSGPFSLKEQKLCVYLAKGHRDIVMWMRQRLVNVK